MNAQVDEIGERHPASIAYPAMRVSPAAENSRNEPLIVESSGCGSKLGFAVTRIAALGTPGASQIAPRR